MLFDPFGTMFGSVGRAGFFPAVDVTVGEHDLVLTMDLPGFTTDDVQIELLDDHLVLRGERKRPQVAEGSRWALTERPFGSFERRIRLPQGVDPDAVTASMDNGVLSLIVPKPEVLKPRTIAIGSPTRQRELEPSTA